MKNEQWSLIRPLSLSGVFGHDLVKKALYKIVKEDKYPRCIVFQGDSGIGKTTFAKLIAKYYVATMKTPEGIPDPKDPECIAVDEETYDRSVFRINGTDGDEGSKKNFTSGSELGGFLANEWVDKKVVMVEEFQGLSSAARSSLLLNLEDPNSNVLYIFTTTGVSGTKAKKEFETLASRVTFFNLETPKPGDVMKFLKSFLQDKGIWDTLPPEFQVEGLRYIGSNFQNYRRALNEVQKCVENQAYTPEQYKVLIKTDEAAESVYQVIKDVLLGEKTQRVVQYIKDLTNDTVVADSRAFKKYLADCEWYSIFNSVPDNNYYQNMNVAEILKNPNNKVGYCVSNIHKILSYDATKADMVLFIAGAYKSSQTVLRETTQVAANLNPVETASSQPQKTRRTLLS